MMTTAIPLPAGANEEIVWYVSSSPPTERGRARAAPRFWRLTIQERHVAVEQERRDDDEKHLLHIARDGERQRTGHLVGHEARDVQGHRHEGREEHHEDGRPVRESVPIRSQGLDLPRGNRKQSLYGKRPCIASV
eukprot:scaffold228_cov312-Pinguiococcus_pyrenoidosus.AAC.62